MSHTRGKSCFGATARSDAGREQIPRPSTVQPISIYEIKCRYRGAHNKVEWCQLGLYILGIPKEELVRKTCLSVWQISHQEHETNLSSLSPGRWYASYALKHVLVYLLTRYNFSLDNPQRPRYFIWTTAVVPRSDVYLSLQKIVD
jgi:hypothetical protein